MPDLDLTFSLPPGHGLHDDVDRALYALASIPERATPEEMRVALRYAASRWRAVAVAFEDAAHIYEVEAA